VYGTEDAVREGMAKSEVAPEDVFVATKVWIDRLGDGDVRQSVEESLERLGIESIDLLYVHWPRGDYEATTTLPQFDALVDAGLVDHIGLSNFSVDQFEAATDVLEHPVAAHQVERHPLFPSSELVAHAQKEGHTFVAYAPSMKGRADELPELREIAGRHGVSPTEISIAWAVSQDNVVAIPKSSDEAHLRANLEAASIQLTEDEIARIDAIEREEELYLE
jgi:2,5-diketo-D-gluconate reductase B